MQLLKSPTFLCYTLSVPQTKNPEWKAIIEKNTGLPKTLGAIIRFLLNQ